MSWDSWGGELEPVVVWSFVACFNCWCHTLTNLKGEKQIPSCYMGHIYAWSLLLLVLNSVYVKHTDFWRIILAQ